MSYTTRIALNPDNPRNTTPYIPQLLLLGVVLPECPEAGVICYRYLCLVLQVVEWIYLACTIEHSRLTEYGKWPALTATARWDMSLLCNGVLTWQCLCYTYPGPMHRLELESLSPLIPLVSYVIDGRLDSVPILSHGGEGLSSRDTRSPSSSINTRLKYATFKYR